MAVNRNYMLRWPKHSAIEVVTPKEEKEEKDDDDSHSRSGPFEEREGFSSHREISNFLSSSVP